MIDLIFYYNNENIDEKTKLFYDNLIQQMESNEQNRITVDIDLLRLNEMTVLYKDMQIKKDDIVTIKDNDRDISVRAKVKKVTGNKCTLTMLD